MEMKMKFENYTVVGLRPNHLSDLSDESLVANIRFNATLKQACGHRFANWMQSVFSHEIKRRLSGGEIEMCSHEMPLLHPRELGKVRSWCTVKTYQADSEAKLYDEILSAVDCQTQYHLEKYAELLEQQ
jgi:hypothetical protein